MEKTGKNEIQHGQLPVHHNHRIDQSPKQNMQLSSTLWLWKTHFGITKQMTSIISDARENDCLFQQLSVALQRGNLVSFLSRFTAS